jgi:multidrug efflux pump subunit AcrB
MNNNKLNFSGKITKYFLENIPLSVLLIILISFLGVSSYFFTPKQYNPEINMPVFQVIVPYFSASSKEVENLVVKELEEKISDIKGVDEIMSISQTGGKAILLVKFFVGEDLEISKLKLESKINENLDQRFAGVEKPLIKNINPDDVPIGTIGFYSDYYTQNQLREKSVEIMEELRNVKNIANLNLHGGNKKNLKILLNPDYLKQKKVSVNEIIKAVKSVNLKLNLGSSKNSETETPVFIDGRIKNLEDLKNIFLLPGIKLEDIAKIKESYEEKKSIIEVFKKDQELKNIVFLSYAKKKSSNAVFVSRKVKELLPQIIKKYPKINYQIFRDEGDFAKKEITNLTKNLFTSIFIVFLVLYLFLGRRSASLIAVSIPLTLALVFFSAFLMGETINRITLFALILSLGLLVDSATVVVENIYRYLNTYPDITKIKAIYLAVNEVGIGLFLSTLTSVIVFLPTSQITGMMGEYMGPLSIFVPLALIFSLIIAYLINPVIAYFFLEKQNVLKKQKLSFFDKLTLKYERLIRYFLDNIKQTKKFLKILLVLFLLVSSFPLFKLVHFKMLPTADSNQFYVYLDAKEGVDYPKVYQESKKIINKFLKVPQINSIQVFGAEKPILDFNGLYKNAQFRNQANLLTLRVNLVPKEDRKIKSTEIVKNLRKEKYFLPATYKMKFIEEPPGPPIRATFVAKMPRDDTEKNKRFLNEFYEQVKKIDGLVDLDLEKISSNREIIYQINHQKLARTGVNMEEIVNTLKLVYNEQNISQFYLKNYKEVSFIQIKFPFSYQEKIENLREVYLKNYQGKMVPFISLVDKKDKALEEVLYRDNQKPVIYLTGEVNGRSVIYVVLDILDKILIKKTLFADYKLDKLDFWGISLKDKEGEKFRINWGGETKMTVENFRDLGIAMIVAFLLVYFVLVAQFKKFLTPVLIMSTIPLSMLGIMPGFFFLDQFFGIFLTATSLIGVIALMGIVVNNAILYLEYLDYLLKGGESLKESLIIAGKTRLRPIVLTSLTTVLGSLTIASDPVWSGLSWVVIFGLSLSAILTLIIFPLIYYLTYRKV